MEFLQGRFPFERTVLTLGTWETDESLALQSLNISYQHKATSKRTKSVILYCSVMLHEHA